MSHPLTYLGHDILHQICSLLSERNEEFQLIGPPDLLPLSMTNKTMRRLSEPMLFEEIVIQEHDGGPEMWQNALRKLEMLNREGHGRGVLSFVKTFNFTISADYRNRCGIPPLKLSSLLTSTLSHLPFLQTLTFSIPHSPDSAFKIFAQLPKGHSLLLPRVQKLVLGPHAEFLVSVCPNLRVVHSHPQQGNFGKMGMGLELVGAVVKAESVRELKFVGTWTLDMAEALAANPGTSNLRIISIVKPRYDVSIADYIKILSPLQNLEELTIAGFSDINMGYAPRCGSAYMGREGFELKKRLNRVRIGIEENIVGMVEGCFGGGSALKRVVIEGRGETTFERRESVGEEEGVGKKWWRVGGWVRERRRGDGEAEEVYVDWEMYARMSSELVEKRDGLEAVVNEEVEDQN